MALHLPIDSLKTRSGLEALRIGAGNEMKMYITGMKTPMQYLDAVGHLIKERKGNVLFNDALNTFYLRLYGVRHMVNDHLDTERRNPLPPLGLLFPISSKGSVICTILQT